MPVNYKQGWAVEKRRDIIAFETIELYHSSIGTLRYITRQQSNKQFTLESDAPRNPSELVTFEPLGFRVQRPAQNNEPVVKLDVQLGRVGTELKQKLKQIELGGFMNQAELIYRVFYDDSPQLILPLEVATITLKDLDAVTRAEQENPTFRDLSRRYLAAEFPVLALST